MRSEFYIWFEKRHGETPHSMDGDYANYTYLKHETEKSWNHRQTEVDELQKQLIDQGQRFNEQVQHIKDLEHKNDKLQKKITELKEIINENNKHD